MTQNTCPKTLLNELNRSRQIVRIFYGDTKTGRDWREENDVYGIIGKSTGTKPIRLIVHPLDIGGPGLLEDCIIRVIDVETGTELYRHPKYTGPVYNPPELKDGFYYVSEKDTDHYTARFDNLNDACSFILYMTDGTPIPHWIKAKPEYTDDDPE